MNIPRMGNIFYYCFGDIVLVVLVVRDFTAHIMQ